MMAAENFDMDLHLRFRRWILKGYVYPCIVLLATAAVWIGTGVTTDDWFTAFGVAGLLTLLLGLVLLIPFAAIGFVVFVALAFIDGFRGEPDSETSMPPDGEAAAPARTRPLMSGWLEGLLTFWVLGEIFGKDDD